MIWSLFKLRSFRGKDKDQLIDLDLWSRSLKKWSYPSMLHMSHSVTLVTRTHGHTFRKCHMYSCPNICIIHFFSHFPMKSLFPVICFVWDATFTDNILSQGSNISLVVTFPWKSHFWEVIFWEVKFSGNSQFLKSYFPEFHIFREVKFPRDSQFPAK